MSGGNGKTTPRLGCGLFERPLEGRLVRSAEPALLALLGTESALLAVLVAKSALLRRLSTEPALLAVLAAEPALLGLLALLGLVAGCAGDLRGGPL